MLRILATRLNLLFWMIQINSNQHFDTRRRVIPVQQKLTKIVTSFLAVQTAEMKIHKLMQLVTMQLS